MLKKLKLSLLLLIDGTSGCVRARARVCGYARELGCACMQERQFPSTFTIVCHHVEDLSEFDKLGCACMRADTCKCAVARGGVEEVSLLTINT